MGVRKRCHVDYFDTDILFQYQQQSQFLEQLEEQIQTLVSLQQQLLSQLANQNQIDTNIAIAIADNSTVVILLAILVLNLVDEEDVGTINVIRSLVTSELKKNREVTQIVDRLQKKDSK